MDPLPSASFNPAGNLAPFIDHTILRPDAVQGDIRLACDQAKQYGFASVCVNPYWVPFVRQQLVGSEVRVCTVVGFPLGASSALAKAQEAQDAVMNGADELDMVLNIGALKSGRLEVTSEELQKARLACAGKILKVILETCLLTREEKILACQLAERSGADFVKTSTGFSKSGATVEDVRLLREAAGHKVRVKASGGIRDAAFARQLVAAGAARIGSSASVELVRGAGAEPKAD